MAETNEEQLLRYLNDAYAAETGAVAALKDMSKDMSAAASNAELRQVVTDHLIETQSQADRLNARIQALGGDKSEAKAIFNETLAKASSLLNVFHKHEDKQTQDTIKAYALENFEIGMYTSLKAFAEAVGDGETAQLAQTIMGEEQMAAERLLRVIPQLAVASVGTAA